MVKKSTDTAATAAHNADQVDVLLKKPHTHAGIDYAPGDTINGMDKSSADWLDGQGICTVANSTTQTQGA